MTDQNGRKPDEWDRQCYGMSEAEVIKEKPDYYDPEMWAMAILSDVQHVIDREDPDTETARRWINKAKFWIDKGRRERRDNERKSEGN